ncbi:MAG: hypothetical protein WC817_05250 [Patescibacteria group bacterium]|jgi:hypothetical protein
MVYLLGTSFVVVFLGMAVKQMSVILMHGSVFAWLRQAIVLRSEQKRWPFIKLHELFTCPLCMTSQVALWVVGAPLAYVLLSFDWCERLFGNTLVWHERVAAGLLIPFVGSMSIAAIALWIWDIVDYKPNKFRAERKRYESLLAEQVDILRGVLQTTTFDPAVLLGLFQELTYEQFTGIVAAVEWCCRDIGCATGRENCRIAAGETVLNEWWKLHAGSFPPFVSVLFKDSMQFAFRFYFANKWRHLESDEKLSAHRRDAYAAFRRQLIGFMVNNGT